MSLAFFAILTATLLIGLPAANADTPAKDTVYFGGPLDGTQNNTRETTLGDLIADAVLDTGQADIALVPADELLDGRHFDAGNHGIDEIVHSLRYPDDDTDTIVILNLTGSQVLHAAERSVSRAPQPFDGFLQVSGLRFHCDDSKVAGKRVSLAKTGSSEIVATKVYRVATTRPAGNGSFGYFKVWDKTALVKDTGVTVAVSLAAYLTTHNALDPIPGRIAGL